MPKLQPYGARLWSVVTLRKGSPLIIGEKPMQKYDDYIMSDEERLYRTIRKGEIALRNLSNLLNTMMSNAVCLSKMGVRDSFGLRTNEVLQVLIKEMHSLPQVDGTTEEENIWAMKKYISSIYRIRRKANTLADIIRLPKYSMSADDLLHYCSQK